MKRFCCICVLYLCCTFCLYAQTGCVYGKVLDFHTAELLPHVGVSLLYNGRVEGRVFTDEQGTYSLRVERNKMYQLRFDKAEYGVVTEDLYVEGADSLQRDAIIGRPMDMLRITEVGNKDKEVDRIDVGALESPASYYVQLFNGGGEALEYSIGSVQEWITEIIPASGVLKPNGNPEFFTIKIDPKKFEAGKTTGKILIKTNFGSKILTVTAVGKFPTLTVLPPITRGTDDPDNLFPDTFIAEIEFLGRHTFEKMGYCFAENDSLPTINDNVVYVNDLGDYSFYSHYSETPLPWLTMEGGWVPCQTFYIRAFLVYNNENKVVHYSKNVQKITLWDILCQ
ncbi:MAG: hypothetical protein NC048_03000 [Bacteroides sp.]|nr:hypothetical protein [Ruminococcus flavefaciens]MCM1554444.1 hypothetical protein [Bacteroides sp.]